MGAGDVPEIEQPVPENDGLGGREETVATPDVYSGNGKTCF